MSKTITMYDRPVRRLGEEIKDDGKLVIKTEREVLAMSAASPVYI